MIRRPARDDPARHDAARDDPGRPDAELDDADPDEADPDDEGSGSFRERTELAWDRTGIAFAALGGAVLKTAPVVGLLILMISAAIFLLARASRPRHRAGGPRQRRSLLLITIAVTVVSLAALVLAVLTGGHPLPSF
jgi:uncharacterized membrane protein YidH (DUF202 family)